MNTNAAVAEPPPSTTSAPPNPAPQQNQNLTRHSSDAPNVSMAEAARQHAEFERTGKKPEQQPPPAKKPEQKAPEQKKTTAKPEEKPATTKGGLTALKEKQTATPKIEDPKGEKGEAEPVAKEQTRWNELRAAEEELKALKPKWDASQKEKAEWEAERAKWTEERKELEQLRKERDMKDFTKSERYKKEVDTPWASIAKRAWDVAEAAVITDNMDRKTLDITAARLHKPLMDAMQEPNPILRERRIKAVLEANEDAKNEVPAGNLAILVQEGDKMQTIFDTIEEMRKNADLEKKQFENQQKAEKLKTDEEAATVLRNAHTEVRDLLKVKANDVLTDDMLEAAYTAAQDPQQTPMDIAYRNQTEYLVPPLIELVRTLRDEIATLKGEKKEEEEVKPGIKPEKEKGSGGKQAPYGSIREATSAHREGGHRF